MASPSTLYSAAMSAVPRANLRSSLPSAEDPNENPDFSPDSTVLVLAADPDAKPIPVPNLTGSSEVLGAESAEPLPKTAPEIVKKMSKLVGYFVQSH